MSHLATIAPLVGIIAREKTTSRPDLYDDARQEGLIRAWTVATAKPDAPREYLVAAARRGVNDVLRGRPSFGEEGRRGWQDAVDSAGPLYRTIEGEDVLVTDPADYAAEDAFRAALDAATATLVQVAVAGLAPADRQLVELRFYEGLDWRGVADVLGKKSEAVRRRFADHIAPALAASLAHLKE